eukprot:g10155.t1
MLVDQVEMFLHPLKIRTRKIKHTHQKYLKRTRQAGGASGGGGGVVQASGRTALTVVDEGVVLELLHDFYCSAGGVQSTKNSSQQTKRADLQHVVQELFIGGHLDDLAGKLFRLCPICTRKLHYLLGPRSDPLERFWYLGKHLRALFPKEGEFAMEQAQAVGCPTHCVGGSAGGGGVGMADVGVAGGSRGRETETRG